MPTKHSKNSTARSIFTYAEHQKLDYGTKRQRLGNESLRRFDCCALCLSTAREPLACQQGHLFCKECVYQDLLTQKTDIKKQKSKLEALKREAEEERERAREAARERVLIEFEKGQRGLGSSSVQVTTSGSEQGTRGTKRKFSFDSSTTEQLAREAEEAALKQIEKEQSESLRAKLPDFWLPSLTPTYHSTGPPKSLQDIKLQTTCHAGNPAHPLTLKTLIPVNFSYQSASDKGGQTTPICPSCKKALSNNILIYVMKPCGHVTCKTCCDSLVRPSKQCVVCDKDIGDEIMELKREGTGFAAGGMAETSKVGIAFQG